MLQGRQQLDELNESKRSAVESERAAMRALQEARSKADAALNQTRKEVLEVRQQVRSPEYRGAQRCQGAFVGISEYSPVFQGARRYLEGLVSAWGGPTPTAVHVRTAGPSSAGLPLDSDAVQSPTAPIRPECPPLRRCEWRCHSSPFAVRCCHEGSAGHLRRAHEDAEGAR